MNVSRLTAVAALSAQAIIAQTAQADPALMPAKVRAELNQSKANGYVSARELEYPPSIIEPDATVSGASAKSDPSRVKPAGVMASGEDDYPLPASRSPGQLEIADTADTLGIVINLNGNRVWVLQGPVQPNMDLS